jgi:hypothetical protein
MNNPKLTNILLIVLIACNILFFAGAHFARHHHRHHNNYSRNDFRGREHGSFGRFHRGFEAYRGNYGGFHGGFRNRNMYNCCRNCKDLN